MKKPLIAYFDRYKEGVDQILLSLLEKMEQNPEAVVESGPPIETVWNSASAIHQVFRLDPSISDIPTLDIVVPRDSPVDPLPYLLECLRASIAFSQDCDAFTSRSIDRLDGVCTALSQSVLPRQVENIYLRAASRHRPMAALISAGGEQIEWIAPADHPWIDFHYQTIKPEITFHTGQKILRVDLLATENRHVPSQNRDPINDMRVLALLPEAPPIIIQEDEWDSIF